MFGQLRLRDTIIGRFMSSDFTIAGCVDSEKVAVKTMNGTSVLCPKSTKPAKSSKLRAPGNKCYMYNTHYQTAENSGD